MDNRSQIPSCPRQSEATGPRSKKSAEGSGWWMAIPVVGMLFCCGGPVLVAWLASAGVIAALGTWWAGSGHWWLMSGAIVGVLALVGIGLGLRWRRRGRIQQATASSLTVR